MGLKGPTRTFFLQISIFFFNSPPPPPVHSSLKKNEIKKKKNPDLPTGRFFAHPADRKPLFPIGLTVLFPSAEVQEMEATLPRTCQLHFDNPNHLHRFVVTITPEDCYWQGGRYRFLVDVPDDYNIVVRGRLHCRDLHRVPTAQGILLQETQRRQYESHNTPLGLYTDQGL